MSASCTANGAISEPAEIILSLQLRLRVAAFKAHAAWRARLQLAPLDRLFDKLSFRAARRKGTLDQQSPRSHTNAGPARKRKRVIGHSSAERGRRIALSHSSPKSAEDARMATKWIYHACVSVTEAFVTTESVRRCYGGLVQNN